MNPLLLFLPVFTNACLKINQLAPPPCACNILTIDPADVYNYEPQSSNFWANKPQTLLRKPIQVVDDCSVKMYCDGEAKLFIFDKTSIREFGEYSAEGFCDPYTQTVLVDLNGVLTTITNLYGICVLSTDSCATCNYLALHPSNIFEIVSTENLLYKIFTRTTIKSPTIRMEDCRISMSCEYVGYSLIMFDPITAKNSGYTFGKSVNATCDKISKYWSDVRGGNTFNLSRMDGVCLQNSGCPCTSLELDSSTAIYYLRQDTPATKFNSTPAITTLSADGCQYMRSCGEGGEHLNYYIPLDKPDDKPHFIDTSISGGSTCDPKTGVWTLREGSTVIETKFFAPMCMYRDLPIN